MTMAGQGMHKNVTIIFRNIFMNDFLELSGMENDFFQDTAPFSL